MTPPRKPKQRERATLNRPDFDALPAYVPEDAPTRTSDGKPWVRWMNTGSYSGWYAVGSRKPNLGDKDSPSTRRFWDAVFTVACACAGGNTDQAHACGRSILSLGGLGVTARSGFAQALLHCCLVTDPTRYVEIMAPVIHATGVFTKATSKSPSGAAFVDSSRHMLLTDAELQRAIMLGSDSSKWTGPQKERAKLWVSCCSELLRDERMDKAQLAFTEEILPALLTDLTKEALKWGRHGPRDFWQYTREQQAIWGLALVLALEDERATEKLMVAARDVVHVDRAYSAEEMLKVVPTVVVRGDFEPAFQERCEKALAALTALMGVG